MKQVKITARVFTNKGTILFTTEDGKNISMNKEIAAMFQLTGDPIPNIGSIVKVVPSTDAAGNVSDQWYQFA